MTYINHYSVGSRTIDHKGKKIEVSNSTDLFTFLNSIEQYEVDVGIVQPGYAHRPDLISDLFYNTVTKDWLIVMFNNIKDPFQQLNVGDQILIPRI